MQRLIDANALYKQIAKKEELARQRVLDTPSRMPNGDFNPSAIRYATQLDERTQMKFMIADAPTIDTEPVKRGKWREYPISDGMNQCSECGVLRFGKSNYCPNCGCRMDVE